ncbi:hypothetical protein RRG08_054290 [Elysia crispata]|uniref:Uncharacterized protein n=1 Tax=Elysia crispata TaxID=231223 RepID=A0AAE1D082_9GAST|nr:hypothetical protein RRG08_054290 [Elysia crispata]
MIPDLLACASKGIKNAVCYYRPNLPHLRQSGERDFDFISLAIVLCSILSLGLIIVPELYKETHYGKKYVWFNIDWYPDNWYKVKDNRHICTVDLLKEALKGLLHQEPRLSETVLSTSICDWFTGFKCCLWLQGHLPGLWDPEWEASKGQ